jgi:hypothetical protein
VTDALLAFLHHLPERELLCFVGLDAVQADVADDEVELTGPRAASTDVGVATGNFATPGVLALQAATARRVVHAGRAHDGEVVLMPGTRWRPAGRARSEDLVVDMLVEVTGATPDPDEAGTLAREVAQALKRDRAHEPHPDLPPGRFQGGLVPSPPGTWELERLDSAERPDFDAMTSEERRAWFAAREASSAERFAEAEPGPLNPQKAADYPHFRRVRSRPEDDDRQ